MLHAKPVVIGFLLMAGVACGESAAPNIESNETELTVLVPYSTDTRFSIDADLWSLEYRAACGSKDTEIVKTEGMLDRAGGTELEGQGNAIFRGPVELLPGPCVIQLLLRDSDAEVIFSASESYEIEERAPPALYIIMADLPCPQVPLPDAATVPKHFCGPAAGLILSAETPAASAAIQGVDYRLTRTLDFFLETVDGPSVETHEGVLEPAGASTADLGSGPMETNVWSATVGHLAASAPYTLEVTALDAEGVAVCTTQTTVEVVPSGIAQAHVVMRCDAP